MSDTQAHLNAKGDEDTLGDGRVMQQVTFAPRPCPFWGEEQNREMILFLYIGLADAT